MKQLSLIFTNVPRTQAVRRTVESSRKIFDSVEVKSIARRFGKLNPYDPSLVPEILKIEDVNFLDSNPSERFRQLFGYAISAKRYALYSRVEDDIHIEKASGHGLGYLFAPKERKKREEDEETPQWVLEAWEFLPDGSACSANTVGLLKRGHVIATDVIPVCKEIDRRWEEVQGESVSSGKGNGSCRQLHAKQRQPDRSS